MQDATHQTPGEDPAPLKTVLLVEDNVAIRDALTMLLHETTPYQVISVPDGFAALKVVRTLVPHLVLLDYLLPGMGGLECLDMLRASKGMEQTPVILMSAGFPEGVEMLSCQSLSDKKTLFLPWPSVCSSRCLPPRVEPPSRTKYETDPSSHEFSGGERLLCQRQALQNLAQGCDD